MQLNKYTMKYGLKGAVATLQEQCWTMLDIEKYKECVLAVGNNTETNISDNTEEQELEKDNDSFSDSVSCGDAPIEPDVFARIWDAENKECVCPSTTIEYEGNCISRRKFYCETSAESYRVAGIWDVVTKQCVCPDGYVLDDRWRKGSCINKKIYECEFAGSVVGDWNIDNDSCDCPSGTIYLQGVGCTKDCLKLTLSCEDYECVGQTTEVYIKQGNSIAYSDADCTTIVTTLPIPTEKNTGYQCDLLSFKDGIICAYNYDGNNYTDNLNLDLGTCLNGYEWQGRPKDLYHETVLQYRCGFCLIGYKYDKEQKKCVKI